MTEPYPPPGTIDDAIGHHFRADDQDDDTEGHGVHRGTGDQDDDTKGHSYRGG